MRCRDEHELVIPYKVIQMDLRSRMAGIALESGFKRNVGKWAVPL